MWHCRPDGRPTECPGSGDGWSVMPRNARIFVAGHRGMVGSAILRQLQALGYENLLTCDRTTADLSRQAEVEAFFRDAGVEQVYLAAAKVGGIHANNTCPAEFIYEPDDRVQCDSLRPSGRSAKAAVSRVLLHLSEAGTPANGRGRASAGQSGAYQ